MKPVRHAQVCLFEDEAAEQFLPLVYFRPVCNLRTGIFSLKEKLLMQVDHEGATMHCRPYLAPYMRLRNPGLAINTITRNECLFVNSRVRLTTGLAKVLSGLREDRLLVCNGNVIAARVSGSRLDRIKTHLDRPLSAEDFSGLISEEIEVEFYHYPWDVVQANGEELVRDFHRLSRTKDRVQARSLKTRGITVVQADNIRIASSAVVSAGTVIDASSGPVVIGKRVSIHPHVSIVGPVYIGDGSIIKAGAQVYGNTSIGPICKIGGEVEGSIFHGYANKQHHGFIGHSYVGAWVNFGAGTTNSDLKNNYGTVRVTIGKKVIDTGQQFVGLTIGDHSKTAINSMFNSGTIVGVSCNIFGFGFPPKYVPSFSWGAAGETFTTFGLEQAIMLARRVMARREILLSDAEDVLFRQIFSVTADERRFLGMPS